MDIDNQYDCNLRVVVTRWKDLTVTNSDGDDRTSKEEVPERMVVSAGESTTIEAGSDPIRRVHLRISSTDCPKRARHVQAVTIRAFPEGGSRVRLSSSGKWTFENIDSSSITKDDRLVPVQRTVQMAVWGGLILIVLLIGIRILRSKRAKDSMPTTYYSAQTFNY